MIQILAKGISLAILPFIVAFFVLEEFFFIVRYRLTGLKPPERKVLP